MRLVVAKSALGGRRYEAIVMDADARNAVVYRSGLGWNKRGRAACEEWRLAHSVRVSQ